MIVGDAQEPYQVEKLRFYALQHPFVCRFVEALAARDKERGRFASLLSLPSQSLSLDTVGIIPPNLFQATYKPSPLVDEREYPHFDVDLRRGGSYTQYNWELFLHIPLLIATRLMQDERHEEAMRWFHYIFNPMTDDNAPPPRRFWNFKPFRDLGKPESIKEMLQALQDPNAAKNTKDEVQAAIREWRDYPFEPHRIARGRPGAYQKTVVMKYLDNLIAWGDKLFRRDTIESINEATHLYVLAATLLGTRPHRVPELATPASATYARLRPKLDEFSNAIVALESIAQPFTPAPSTNGKTGAGSPLGLGTLYFCLPPNEDLLRYWDTVADRLFKIRHCMNIEGVVRELPLFEPPIDPALLVRARALGLDLASVLDDLSAPAPQYRFPFMLQKAREFCEELKLLGGLLLAAVEKRDAEHVSQLRAAHEKTLLKAVLEVRKQQLKEAEQILSGLERGKELAELRKQHYETVSNRLSEEKEYLDKQTEAVVWQIASQMATLAGSSAAAAPEVYVFKDGQASGELTKVVSGAKIGMLANLTSTYLGWLGQIASLEGATASFKGGLIRAQQDRDLQIKLAAKELQQYEKQIAAAEIRRHIAERELANHELQIEQAEKIEDFLREKFTNEDLYSWMVSQLSGVYFQAYRLAYDTAKRAERTFRMELGIKDSSFIQFGAWDSLRQGLLAGEKLSLDLRRLEAAYLDQNKRTYELTKHVSLVQLDPEALIQLRVTGNCNVQIPEVLFDLDYPSHYMRRIKSVSMTIPCVTGPYTTVSCTLTLLKHRIRRTTKPMDSPEPDFTALQSITTSGGRNDTGLFELNFRDERRLPFEGAGVESSWEIELPTRARQFDYDTISDVILHISYTALEGGSELRKYREENLQTALNGLVELAGKTGLSRAFNLRHDFPNEWHRLRQGQEIALTIGRDRLPYFASLLKPPEIQAAMWLTKMVKDAPKPKLTMDAKDAKWEPWKPDPSSWHYATKTVSPEEPLSVPFETSFTVKAADAAKMEALLLVITYSVTV